MQRLKKYDTVLALTVFFLVVFGLVMITSIGVPKSISLSAPNVLYPNCSDEGVDCYLLFKKHIFRLLFGLGAFFIAWKLPLKIWFRSSKFIFLVVVLLLFIVLIMGSSFNTIAQSWLRIFDTSVQPSEIAKVGLVLYLAYWFSKKTASVSSFYDGFLPFLIICSFVLFPVIMQNDFGSTLVLGVICLAIYVVAGANIKHLAILTLVGFLGIFIVISAVPHVKDRFMSYLLVDQECLENSCWQSQQANIAVGSGGVLGKGLAQGVQKSYWLPQASDDFIFAASAEELGFLRIIFIVLAYFVIAYRGFMIANNAEGKFETYVAVGITSWITIQAFINIAVNTALMPVTGVTLPFVSYGGSSLVTCLIGIGILLNISKSDAFYENSTNRRGDRGARNSQSFRYRRA